MIPARQIQANRVEIGEMESLIRAVGDDPLARPLLESRLADVRHELSELEKNPVISPETELLFAGAPVVGSLGIEARFAGKILTDFQDMVANHHAGMRHGGAGNQGRRPGEGESKVYLSALPRGSFGLLLAQHHIEDFITAQHIAEEMEQITALIESATSDDISFINTISEFDPRVLVPLKRFYETLETNRATVTIRTGRKTVTMNSELVHAGYIRVAGTEEEASTETLSGTFGGLTAGSRSFDFTPDGLPLITGKLDDAVSEVDALNMIQLYGMRATAVLKSTQIKTLTGSGKPRYSLVSLTAAAIE